MRVYGIDFTSRPTPRKAITCMACSLVEGHLAAVELHEWRCFEAFEAGLRRPGPWIAGIDFPFGQSRRFIDNIGWPGSWAGYVAHVATLQRSEFRAALDDYQKRRGQVLSGAFECVRERISALIKPILAATMLDRYASESRRAECAHLRRSGS